MGRRFRPAVGAMVSMVLVLLSGALIGCGGGRGGSDRRASGRPAATPTPTSTPPAFDPSKAEAGLGPNVSVVARVPGDAVEVHRGPSPSSRHHRLRARRFEGHTLPLVLLVKRRKADWIEVRLPTRPNLSTGWVRRRDVTLRADPYRVRIDLRRHRVTAWHGKHRIARTAIGVGKSLTPTPTGLYYITDLIRPPDPGGTYGPFAFGLSAHSPVYTSFGSGDGQVGLHGTNDPSGLGQDVSAGCVRVDNDVIRRLARTLPIGTPVTIRR